MNAIQLLGLMPSRHLKTYGINPLLEAFMDDLSKLERVCTVYILIHQLSAHSY